MNQILIAWTADEHVYTHKTSEWYWTVGTIGATLAALSFIFSNVILGILFVVSTVALCLAASQEPRRINYSINDRGIVINDRLYTFLSLKAFWIEHDSDQPSVLIRSNRPVMPYIHLPIDEVDPEDIRDVLLKYLPETKMEDSKAHKIFDQLGF